ncbi:S1C family serine protease [Demequina oxidasica]|uniref:S1C family serine protease n=1 Tax=Demequina oxidasica TaxID=676199 RepID=UPI000781CA0E|nr:trypsin-like peptidase domain-containing protein [Demequina oxidasica]
MTDSPFAPPTPVGGQSPRPEAGDDSQQSSSVVTEASTREEVAPTADAGMAADAAAGSQYGTEVATAQPETFPWEMPPADVPPVAPKAPVGRVRKRTVAAICVGALALGILGGAGGAWAYNEWGPSSSSVALPAVNGTSVDRPEGSVASIAAAVMPSVVSIETATAQGSATGTGFVIREDGYILTNNHVVDGANNDTVKVLKSDGSIEEGKVIGTTPEYDLAVVKIDEKGLSPLVLGDSDQVVVGDAAIAVGSPLGLDSTVTTGIISALHRPVTAGDGTQAPAYIDAIQTDAAINPGNSGGPLINSAGEVIGINSAIASLGGSATQQAGSVGLGFAITSNQARRTAEQLINDGEATFPVIGVLLDERYNGEGIKVVDDSSGVIADGPSAAAGIEPGDIITQIDGRPVTRSDELVVAIRAKAPGDDVVLTVKQGDSTKEVTVTLGSNSEVNVDEPAPNPSE